MKPSERDTKQQHNKTLPMRPEDTPAMPFAATDMPLIREIEGRYLPVSSLGKGGMGEVTACFDTALDRTIAYKRMIGAKTGETARDSEEKRISRQTALGRFLQEARLTGRLEHPSIVPVYELGRGPDDTPYYTMKLVRGKTLSEAIQEEKDFKKRLRLLTNFNAVCQAMAYAHSKNVLHRDLKSNNIMLGEFGETIVLDWGLAKVRGEMDVHEEMLRSIGRSSAHGPGDRKKKPGSFGSSSGTMVGDLIGTPAYMSPEQALGKIEEITERSDVYALGVILFEMLTRQLPFQHEDAAEVLRLVIGAENPDPRNIEARVPPELAAICMRAMSKNPAVRYADAGALGKEISRYLAGQLVEAYRYGIGDLIQLFYRRYRAPVITATVSIFGLLVVLLYSYISIYNASQREHTQFVAAEAARESATAAQKQSETQNYLNQIQLASEYLSQGNTALADDILWKTSPEQRNWEWGYLLSLANSHQAVIEDQGRPIFAGFFNPEGNALLVMSNEAPLKLYDPHTGKILRELEYGPSRPSYAAWSPDGKTIAVAYFDLKVVLYDAASGRVIVASDEMDSMIYQICFSPDGRWLAVLVDRGRSCLLNTSDMKRFADIDPAITSGGTGTFAPNTPRFALKHPNFQTGIYDVRPDGITHIRTLPGSNAQWSSDESLLITRDPRSVYLWDAASFSKRHDLVSTQGDIAQARLLPDGRQVVVATHRGHIALYDCDSGEAKATFEHGETLTQLVIDRTGERLITAGRITRIWNLATGKLATRLPMASNSIRYCELSPDGTLYFSTDAFSRGYVWRTNLLPGTRAALNTGGDIGAARLSSDASWLAASDAIGTIHAYNLKARRKVVTFAPTLKADTKPPFALSPDGTLLVVAPDDFTALVWDIGSRNLLASFQGHLGTIKDFDFSPDGTMVLSSGWDRRARLWNPKTGEQIREFEPQGGTISFARFLPGGKHILTSSEESKETAILDVETGTIIERFEKLPGMVTNIAFDPIKNQTIACLGDGSLLFLEAREVATRTAPASDFKAAFVPSSTRLLTLGNLSSTRDLNLHDPENGTILAHLPAPAIDRLSELRSIPDGPMLAVTTSGTVCELAAVPWRLENNTTGDNNAWRDMAARYLDELHQSADAAISTDANQNDLQIAIAQERLVACLENLAIACDSTLANTSEEQAWKGLRISPGPLADAAARMGLRPDDTLINIIGRTLEPANCADQLRKAAMQVNQTYNPNFFSLTLQRNGTLIKAAYTTIPLTKQRTEVQIGREEATAMLRWELQALRENRDVITQVSARQSRLLGELPDDAFSFSGMFIVSGGDATFERGMKEKIGVPDQVRMIRVNGDVVRSVPQMMDYYADLLRRTEAGEALDISFELECGEFIHKTIQLRLSHN